MVLCVFIVINSDTSDLLVASPLCISGLTASGRTEYTDHRTPDHGHHGHGTPGTMSTRHSRQVTTPVGGRHQEHWTPGALGWWESGTADTTGPYRALLASGIKNHWVLGMRHWTTPHTGPQWWCTLGTRDCGQKALDMGTTGTRPSA